jgi:hypothetical protein
MIGGLACCAALLPVAFAGAVSRSHTASAALCSTSHLEVWLGDGSGGGTAGRTYYPLEFSNVGHSACALYGYPGVSAWALNGVQVGLPATHSGASHSLVTLAPGATAHALLAVVDWGAVCATGVNALGLKVFPPGQKAAQTFSFPLEGCAGKSTLVTGPVRAGVGIPGYTTS